MSLSHEAALAQRAMDDRIHVDLKTLIKLQYQARGFSFLPSQPLHSIRSGKHSSRLRGRGLNFEELRHYRPGDDIRSLDWKVTNRTGKPHVRTYTEERERSVVVVVDQRIGMFFGSIDRMKSVVAAEAAALSAWRVLGVGDRVGAVVFNDTGLVPIRPHRSSASVVRICQQIQRMNHELRADAIIEPAVGLNDVKSNAINNAIDEAARMCAHDGLMVIVSDMAGWNEQTVTLLRRFSIHNDALVALVYDPLETELAEVQPLVVSDGRMQIEVSAHKDDLQQRYADAYSASLNELESTLQRYRIPVLPLNTTEKIVTQVRRAMGEKLRNG